MTHPRSILNYWFGELDAEGLARPEQNALWFGYKEATDTHILDQYGGQVEAALRGELDHWMQDNTGLLAMVILLDQFTRNIYRGTPASFSGDDAALAMSSHAVQEGRHLDMPVIHRVFLYIPYEHSEDLTTQDAGIALFDELTEEIESPGVLKAVAGYRDYAVAHRAVIEKFGRFPHRNSILGRQSSAAELAHLEQHGGF